MRAGLTFAGVAAALALAAALSGQILINGAGATFPYPVYAAWFDAFHRIHPDALINYQPIGSRAGIRQLQVGVLDLGASDMPLADQEAARLLHFPTVVGAVVPIYNVPGLSKELNFTAQTLSGIFRGVITRWNDARIAVTNPGISLPAADILVVHRSDGSGTTYILTDFLSKADKDWKASAGLAPALKWKGGIGARGNEGVAGIVKQTPYAIGYAEQVYAVQSRIPYGRVQNPAGRFVKADVASIKAAAAARADAMPDDFRVSITNVDRQDAYPIAGYSWLLAPERIADPQRRKIILEFLRWMLTQGQSMTEPLGYAPLPTAVAAKAIKACDRIK